MRWTRRRTKDSCNLPVEDAKRQLQRVAYEFTRASWFDEERRNTLAAELLAYRIGREVTADERWALPHLMRHYNRHDSVMVTADGKQVTYSSH